MLYFEILKYKLIAMYYYKPFFHKYKNYYEEVIEVIEAPEDTTAINNLKNAILTGTIDDIRNAANNLPTDGGGTGGRPNNPNFKNALVYGGGNCDCSIYIQVIQDSVQKMIQLDGQIPKPNFNVDKPFNTSMRTVLSWRHVRYIQKYGVPDDGVFVEELLNEFEE